MVSSIVSVGAQEDCDALAAYTIDHRAERAANESGRPPDRAAGRQSFRPSSGRHVGAEIGLAVGVDRLVVGIVLDIGPRHDLDDLQKVELVFRFLLAAHHQNVLEALMIRSAVFGWTVAHAVELEALQRLDHRRRIKSAGCLHGIGIEQRLYVAGLRSLRRRRTIDLAERLGEDLGGRVVELLIAAPAPSAINSEKSGTTIWNCLPLTILSRKPNCTAWVSEWTMSAP